MAADDARRSRARSPKPGWLLFAGFLVVAVSGTAVYAWGGPGVQAQIRQTVSQQSSPFTELYFTNPSTLPTAAAPETLTGFEFTIVNHERRPTSYRYTVFGHTPGASEPVDTGDVTLPVSAATSIPVARLPTTLGPDYVLTVRLVNRAETIHLAIRS